MDCRCWYVASIELLIILNGSCLTVEGKVLPPLGCRDRGKAGHEDHRWLGGVHGQA